MRELAIGRHVFNFERCRLRGILCEQIADNAVPGQTVMSVTSERVVILRAVPVRFNDACVRVLTVRCDGTGEMLPVSEDVRRQLAEVRSFNRR